MARSIVFVPSSNPTKGSRPIALDDVPQDVRDEVEEAYAAMKSNPNGRFRATFDSKAELLQYLAHANAYCANRPETLIVTDENGTETVVLAGPIRFRRSPSKGLPENVMDYRVTDLQTEEEKRTEEIRKATAEANRVAAEAAGKKPVGRPKKAVATAAKAA